MFIAFLKSVYRMNLVAEDLGWVGLILICPMSHAQFCLVSHLGCPIYTNTECIGAEARRRSPCLFKTFNRIYALI